MHEEQGEWKIVMTAGQLKEFGDRRGTPTTPERVVEW